MKMKTLLLTFFTLLIIVSCTLIETNTDVKGVYLYTGAFISQRLYIDSTDISAGDTILSAGAIILTWNTIENISGDKIKIEKSIKDNNSYTLLDTVPVNKDGSYTDSILSGNTYYYKLTLISGDNERFMNEYEIIVPQLTFSNPSILDTTIPPTGFNIVYNNINPDNDYKITLKDADRNKLWEFTTSDTNVVYNGDSLSSGIYILEVLTIFSDVVENQSVVSTTGITQFFIK